MIASSSILRCLFRKLYQSWVIVLGFIYPFLAAGLHFFSFGDFLQVAVNVHCILVGK